LAIYGLVLVLKKEKKFSYKYILLLIVIMALTQSASGVVGIIIGLSLMLIFGNFYKYRNLIYLIILVFVLFLAISFITYYDTRVNIYLQEIETLFTNLNNKSVTDLILIQSPDIIPLWSYFNQVKDFDLFHIFFGSGSGSTSLVVNSYLEEEMIVNNPRSNLVRILFSTGLLGMFFYLKFLIFPIKEFVKEIENKNGIYILYSSLLLFGCTLGHRSLLGFLFIGIIITILVNNLYYKNEKKS